MSRERAIDDHAELADVLRQAMVRPTMEVLTHRLLQEVQQSSAQAINQIDKVHGKIGANPEGSVTQRQDNALTVTRSQ